MRRTNASTTTETIELMLAGPAPASSIPITAESSSPAGRRNASKLVASSIARLSMNGVRVSAASRSMWLTTPSSSRRAEITGMCWTPLSSIVTISSATGCSASAVITGVVITSLIGVSSGNPAAIARERRSRSVTIPSSPSPRSTRIEPASSSRSIRAAASRRVRSGSQSTARSRTRLRAGAWPASTIAARAVGGPPGSGRSISDLATERRLAGSESSGITSSAASR